MFFCLLLYLASINDYSRQLFFADFSRQKTSWVHIQATQTLIQTYGVPFKHYVDSLHIFRFVQGHDSFWWKYVLEMDDVHTQWKKVL